MSGIPLIHLRTLTQRQIDDDKMALEEPLKVALSVGEVSRRSTL